MRKIVSLLILSLLVNVASAQWSVGGKFGTNLSKAVNCPNIGGVSSKEIFDIQSRVGMNIGGVVNYQINDKFDLQGELLYSFYNYKDKDFGFFEGNGSLKETGLKTHRHFLDVPLLIQFYPVGHDLGFNVEAGVQPGFFLSESNKAGNETITTLNDSNPVNFCLIIGSSYKSSKNWFVDFRYVFGLTDSYKNLEGMNMQSAQLSIGYLFHL